MRAQALPAVEAFVAGLVDYAGLFPPAALDMASAVHNYSAYRSEPHAAVLGRFVVPARRLPEFSHAAAPLLPRRRGDTPWRLAVLGGADPAADVRAIAELGPSLHRTGDAPAAPPPAIADLFEVKAGTVMEIEAVRTAVPAALHLFIEVAPDADLDLLLPAVLKAGAGAKLRTGGVTPDAIPPVESLARFLVRAARLHLPFKATAGLHHAIRGSYALTYAPDSPRAVMHGFINVFMAAVLARAGGSLEDVGALLDEMDVATFRFGPVGLRWREHHFTLAQLEDTRQHFARSFGSCSFREPIEELHAWGLL